MTGASIRTGRRRMQDAAVRWQEFQDRLDRRQQPADSRRKRFSCADSLKDYQQAQDWTGQMGLSPSGRFQVIEEKQKRVPLVSREGLQWRFGWAVLTACAVLMAVILLGDVFAIGNSERTIGRLNNRIELISAKNEQLASQLDISAGDITVCTEAVKLNLISAYGASTVRLDAPQGANLTLAANAAQGQGARIASAMGD